jgi:hypothetical protein
MARGGCGSSSRAHAATRATPAINLLILAELTGSGSLRLVRALLFLLALTACRRAPTPVAKEDPVTKQLDAAPALADDPLLIHGKVVDLKTFKIAHRLTSERPYEELTSGGIGFLSVRRAGVEAYDLATGTRRFATAVKCARFQLWARRLVCANNDELYIIDEDGKVKSGKVAGRITGVHPLTSGVLVQRFSGEADVLNADAVFVKSHPRIDPFDSVLTEGDSYCVLKDSDFELECRKPDGSLRSKIKLSSPAPSGPMRSTAMELLGDAMVLNTYDTTKSATTVIALRDGRALGRLTPAADKGVTDASGTLVALLRRNPLELITFPGSTAWKLARGYPGIERAIVSDDTLFIANDRLAAALRRKDGSTIWEQSFEPTVVDGGYAHITTSVVLRGSLLLLRTEAGTSGRVDADRLRILDSTTGKEMFVDTAN